MRVLVTGSRQFLDQSPVYGQLDDHWTEWWNSGAPEMGEQFAVVHGNAPGADTLANQWCWDHRESPGLAPVEVHPADWRRGRFAGHQRNYEMVRLGADLVLAFFQLGAANAGTRNCVENAQRWLPDTPIVKVWSDGSLG